MTTQPRRRKRRRLLPNPAFLPRCEWALRTGLAVALMSVLTFSPATAGKVALPGFGAFVAVMVVEMTLGKTLANVVGCTKGAALSCLGCKLLQLFLNAAVPARAGRVVLTHLLHFGACFLMASAPLPPMARKLGLSMFPLLLVNRLPLSSSSSSSTSSSSSSSSSSSASMASVAGSATAGARPPFSSAPIAMRLPAGRLPVLDAMRAVVSASTFCWKALPTVERITARLRFFTFDRRPFAMAYLCGNNLLETNGRSLVGETLR